MNFWSVLQVGEDHVARFAVLDPEFLDGKLWVNPGVGGDCVDVLAQMQLHVMRFANFSDSNWLGSGSGTRTLVKCVRMGISHLANYTRAYPHATDCHLHGIERLHTKFMVSVIIIAVSSQVSDDMMKSVLADDRVAAKLDELKEIQSTALKFQVRIPLSTWKRLADLTKEVKPGLIVSGDMVAPGVLRSHCLRAGHVQAAYQHHKFLEPAEQYPWKLFRGNLNQNLDTLSGITTKLQDTTTEKIFQMLKLGVSRAALVSGIELLGEVSWSSVAAEQGHGSCATVRRFHGTATGHTISCRAMLHQGRFFFNQDHLLQHQLKLEKRLGMLERQQPQKTSAYAMFFKEFHATTRLQLSTRYDQSFGQSQQVLTASSRLWCAMIPKQKAYYEDLKVHFVQEKQKALMDVKEDIMAQLVLERHRVLKAKQKCDWPARFLSGTRFNDRDLQRLQVWITRGEGMAQNNFHKVLQDMFESPVEPPMYEQGFFESCEKVAAQRPALQSWARAVADNRDCFLDCIFIQASDTSQGFMYM